MYVIIAKKQERGTGRPDPKPMVVTRVQLPQLCDGEAPQQKSETDYELALAEKLNELAKDHDIVQVLWRPAGYEV